MYDLLSVRNHCAKQKTSLKQYISYQILQWKLLILDIFTSTWYLERGKKIYVYLFA